MSDEFYLQSPHGNTGDGLMFWALTGGYCTDLAKAEVFTRERAQQLHDSRGGEDRPWLKAYIDERSHLGVDHQYVRQDEAAPLLVEGCVCVIQIRGEWNGNDMVWARWPIGGSPKFEQAHRMDYADAMRLSENEIVWPLAYIEGKTRRLVHHHKLSHKEAMGRSGIKLYKPKVIRNRYRCDVGCGQFLKERDFYGTCPGCGANNY